MFLESPSFPNDIDYGLTGGPQYQTQIIEQISGWEQANSLWAYPKHIYQLSYAAKDIPTTEKLLHFFHTVKGRAYGFRFRDPNDYKSCLLGDEITACNQTLIGAVDGANACFHLAKIYSFGDNEQHLATVRPIHKPVRDTVQIAINGIRDKRWQCDYTRGKISFMPDVTANITVLAYNVSSQQLTLTAANNLSVGDSVYLNDMQELPALNQQRFGVIAATAETVVLQVQLLDSIERYTSHGSFHTLPQPGEVVTAGFEFDVPVRFASDSLSISSDSYQVSSIQQLGLVEIRI